MNQMFSLTSDQQSVLQKIQSFIHDSGKQVFILKGAAGSGKTTLIKELIEMLHNEHKAYQLMAPTGRAAKILRDKTGVGTTIHRGIYNFDRLESKEIDSDDASKKNFHYYFPLSVRADNQIVIVDEASMVSDVETQHELFTFGTGRLLSDLIEYVNFTNNKSKLIFVGDNAQLPPVTDNISSGLNEGYFQEKGFKTEAAELQTIHRQLENSGILQNANNIKALLKLPRPNRNTFKINTNNNDVNAVTADHVASDYVNRFPNPEVGNGVIITFSNAQTREYNHAVRSKIFPFNPDIVSGDVIIVNNNNYHSYGTEMFNGDMAKVVEAEPSTETKNVPVFIDGKKKNISLTFRNIVIQLPHFEENISCKIIDSLLNSSGRDLSVYEMKALYIDFCMRFNDEQKQRKEKGLQTDKEGSAEFKNRLKDDPYFNALRIKYGYAITCHKAQGGEWDTVYVDYSGRIGLHDDALRWCYTATTRAKKELIVTNIPDISVFDKMKFSAIAQIGKADNRYYQSSKLYPTPFHGLDSNLGKRLKYHEIVEKLNNTPYSINNVLSNNYLEKYSIDFDGKEFIIDLYHDGSGIFNNLSVTQEDIHENRLLTLINEPFKQEIPMSYLPTTQLFQKLYQKVSAICCELEIQITNVIEEPEKHYVLYCFKTSGNFSMIQFYYKQTSGFSTAMPKSDIGNDDEKLKLLIHQLE